MSVPPQLIRVKRKATEEAPVSFLRVQEHKRQRSDGYVYQRQNEEAAVFADIPPPPQIPTIHTSEKNQVGTSATFQRPEQPKNSKSKGHGSVDTLSVVDTNTPDPDSAVGASEPRRFHMSRQDMMLAASNYPSTRTHAGVSKKRSPSVLFVERKIKRLPSKKFDSLAHDINAFAAQGPGKSSDALSTPAPLAEQMDLDMSEPRRYKRPGRFAQKTSTPNGKAELPSAVMDRWNVNLDKLTADMDAFAMEQIGLNLQKEEEEKQREQQRTSSKQTTPLKFKPKPPSKRYAERHPEVALDSVDKDMLDMNVDTSDTDDDYIIETYIRVPASAMEKKHVAPQDVGVLVFDAEPDLALFYGDGDSEDELDEDDEDENAENYYTADYPDDEVASDDEFGQNPYSYRNGNASDLEEFDILDDTDSNPDDGLDAKGSFKKFIGKNGLVTKHI